MSDTAPDEIQKASSFILCRRPNLRQFGTAVLIFVLLLLFVMREALPHLSTHFLGGAEGDPGLYIWLAKTNQRDLFSLPWFDSRAFYPYGYSLAWSDNFILPSFVIAFFQKIGFGFTSAYNLTILGAHLLNGICVFLLVFQLSAALFPAIAAGWFAMLFPFLYAQVGHAQLQFVFVITVSLIAYFRYLHRPNFTRAVCIALTIGAAFLTTVYYAVISAVLIAAISALIIWLRPQALRLHINRSLLLGLACGAAPFIPFALPYLKIRDAFGERNVYEAYYFSADAWSYISASALTRVFAATVGWSHPEANLWFGLILLTVVTFGFLKMGDSKHLHSSGALFVLALFSTFALSLCATSYLQRTMVAVGLWITIISFMLLLRKLAILEERLGSDILTMRDLFAVFFGAALFLIILSFGPLANPTKGQLAISPYIVFYEMLPGASALRAISRTGLAAQVLTCAAAGIALVQLRPKITPLFSFVILLGALIEGTPRYIPSEAAKPAPMIMQKLNPQSHAIVLPLTSKLDSHGEVVSWSDFARHNTNAMNWAYESGATLLNGYSGQKTKLMRELPRELENFPDRRSYHALCRIFGLHEIVYVPSLQPQFDRLSFDSALKELTPNLEKVSEADDGSMLFRLNCEELVAPDLELQAPALPGATLLFNLRALEKSEGTATITLNDQTLGNIGSAELKLDGSAQPLQINLHSIRHDVRPLRLTIASERDLTLFLGETTFVPGHSPGPAKPGN